MSTSSTDSEQDKLVRVALRKGKTLVAMHQAYLLAQRTIDSAELAQRMREKRAARSLTIQKAAVEAGVSAATFSRVARGDHVPDFENMLLLAQWVGVARVQLPVIDGEMEEAGTAKTITHSPNETTLESVALHLHADENLKPEDVDLLMNVLREQYTFLLKRNQDKAPR